MTRTKTFYDLRDAFALSGCPICRLAHRAADKFIDTLLWEMVNDPQARQDIRRAQGFCHDHAWRLLRAGPTLGTTIVAHDVLRDVLRTVAANVPKTKPQSLADRVFGRLGGAQRQIVVGDELRAALTPEGECLACEQAKMAEAMAVDTFLEHLLEDDGLLTAFRTSEGLCVAHLRVVASRSRDDAVLHGLVAAQTAIWARLADHLAECIRKCDYRFAGEERGEETGACERAITALAGARPDDLDRETSPVVFPFRGRKRVTE